ncbi:SIMPL domain-containing protein [Gorillibacterium sp. CAU 1737]|uniref:SIMPL domain-containing protein n=1 Tax=Gorillibacterium sp. CAU 1737 TaxID=3140362 RepID=UPI0032618B52
MPSMMEVNGEGTVTAVPDRALIVLGVVTEGPNLSAVQRENTQAITNVVAQLTRLNIPKEQIQTVTYRIEMVYSNEEDTQTLKGYRVTHLLQIMVYPIELTGRVVDTAVQSGANIVSSIQFTIGRPEAFYNQALANALQDAAIKAQTIARTLGATLARLPVKVTEETRGPELPVPFQGAFLAQSASTPILPGELTIRATVRVQYPYD